MASPNSTFTELVTTTLRNDSREMIDNVSAHNALLTYLKEKGKIRTEGGGLTITVPLEYAENGTYLRYSGYDPLNTQPSDVLTRAEYNWRNVAIHVTASGEEIRKNSSKEAMIKLVKARVANAMHTAANNMSIDLYSDGSLTNQIGGLGLIIQNAGTGTVGGIVSGTYTFWKNKFTEATGTDTISASTITGEMNTEWLKQVRGKDKPDLIISTNDFYSKYEASLQTLQRYVGLEATKKAAAGFEALAYKTAMVIHDENTNFASTGEKMYFLNTDYLYLIEHSDARWTEDDEKRPLNQDAVVIPMYWMGQLVCSNRALQGCLIDAA